MDFIFTFLQTEYSLTGKEIILLVFLSMMLGYILLFMKLILNYRRIVVGE